MSKPIVKVRKKGKTRGRPSKWEKSLSAILSWQLEKSRPEIMKAHEDMILYGQGCIEFKPNGTIKRRKINADPRA